jgi:hypothetical protein
MSAEIICDHCGQRAEPGIATFQKWEVSSQGGNLQLDLCSERCIVEFIRLSASKSTTTTAYASVLRGHTDTGS